MEKNYEELLRLAGGENKYQYFFLIILAIFWISNESIVVSLAYLEIQCDATIFTGVNYIKTHVDFNSCNSHPILLSTNPNSWLNSISLCCNQLKISLIGCSYFFGYLIGSIFVDKFTESIGRKKTLILFGVIFSIMLQLLAITDNILIKYIIMCFISASSAINAITSYIMMSESVNSERRQAFGAMAQTSYCLSGIFFILMFKYLQYWQIIIRIASLLELLICVIAYFYLVETIRFYILTRDFNGFIMSLRFIARTNGKKSFDDEIGYPALFCKLIT